MDSRTIIRLIEAAGWHRVRTTGSHHHFRRGEDEGTVTVVHPQKDVPIGTEKDIERRSGVGLRGRK